MTAQLPQIDATQFRQVLGQYPTGVVVVTAMGAEGEPLGMTVGSFVSVSLDPPLVAFLPDQKSSSWAALRASGPGFCVNILAADQEEVCRQVAMRKTDKLAGIAWQPSAAGNPVLDLAVAHIDCVTDVIHDAGDHHLVVGRVLELDVHRSTSPLLFFRGGYGSFRPASLAAADADLLDQLRAVDRGRPIMEELASRFGTEVTAMGLIGDELVVAAAAGATRQGAAPTRVGQRVPFRPPLGSGYAAFGTSGELDRWLAALEPGTSEHAVEEFRRMAERVREQGYSFALEHQDTAYLDQLKESLRGGDPSASQADLLQVVGQQMATYNPATAQGGCNLRTVIAPVYDQHGQVAFLLSLWGPGHDLEPAQVQAFTEAVVDGAARITQALAASPVPA